MRAIVIDYPRFFTPNGDGYNDRWNLKNITTLTGNEYQLNYNVGYTDIYTINIVDDNTMNYEYDGTVYTYKKVL
jgi:gliding motility-associated-like protein